MNDKARIIDAMVNHGRPFVQRLALAWRYADAEDSAKIEATWPEYIETYRRFAEDDKCNAEHGGYSHERSERT